MIATLKPEPEIEYPTSDGMPMAETELHWREISELINILDRWYRDRMDVYVAANNFFYFEKGNPKACFAADAYVVFGVEKKVRACYKLWEEGQHVPAFVMEFTSRSTRDEDNLKKRSLYAKLGVPEFFLYDPYSEYLDPALQGFRLNRGKYVPIRPDSEDRIASDQLKLKFGMNVGGLLEVFDSKTGLLVPRGSERERNLEMQLRLLSERAQRAEDHAKMEAENAQSELARLKAEMERMKKS